MVESSPSIDGISTWTNAVNGFRVCRVHYTADPSKRSIEWKQQAKQGMPARGWEREFEISWTSPEGEPVVPEFDSARHCRSLRTDPSSRLLRFWDFGYITPAVVFAQLDSRGILRVLAESVPFNTPLDSLIAIVRSRTMELGASTMNPFDAGDPAANAETDLGSIKRILQSNGIVLATTRPGTESSYESLRKRFRDSVYVPGVGLEPSILIDRSRCPNLVEALSGAFYLSSHPPYRPVKMHPWKDIVDALRYGNDNLATVNVGFQHAIRQMASIDRVW